MGTLHSSAACAAWALRAWNGHADGPGRRAALRRAGPGRKALPKAGVRLDAVQQVSTWWPQGSRAESTVWPGSPCVQPVLVLSARDTLCPRGGPPPRGGEPWPPGTWPRACWPEDRSILPPGPAPGPEAPGRPLLKVPSSRGFETPVGDRRRENPLLRRRRTEAAVTALGAVRGAPEVGTASERVDLPEEWRSTLRLGDAVAVGGIRVCLYLQGDCPCLLLPLVKPLCPYDSSIIGVRGVAAGEIHRRLGAAPRH